MPTNPTLSSTALVRTATYAIPTTDTKRPFSNCAYASALNLTKTDGKHPYLGSLAARICLLFSAVLTPLDIIWNMAALPITVLSIAVKYTIGLIPLGNKLHLGDPLPGLKALWIEIKMIVICAFEVGILPLGVLLIPGRMAILHARMIGYRVLTPLPSNIDEIVVTPNLLVPVRRQHINHLPLPSRPKVPNSTLDLLNNPENPDIAKMFNQARKRELNLKSPTKTLDGSGVWDLSPTSQTETQPTETVVPSNSQRVQEDEKGNPENMEAARIALTKLLLFNNLQAKNPKAYQQQINKKNRICNVSSSTTGTLSCSTSNTDRNRNSLLPVPPLSRRGLPITPPDSPAQPPNPQQQTESSTGNQDPKNPQLDLLRTGLLSLNLGDSFSLDDSINLSDSFIK